jgi:hypothetical protein
MNQDYNRDFESSPAWVGIGVVDVDLRTKTDRVGFAGDSEP